MRLSASHSCNTKRDGASVRKQAWLARCPRTFQSVMPLHPHHQQPLKRCSGLVHVADEHDVHTQKLGPNVLAGVKELKENIQWRPATVIRNDAITLDGSKRLLHLSVEDHVKVIYKRNHEAVNTNARWVESYTLPGQHVGIRLPAAGLSAEARPARRLYTIASSPYQSRRDSAMLDASLIEIVADRTGCPDDQQLAELGPGSIVEVSQVVGRGFASLFNSYVGLLSAMEEGRPLLIIALGTRGIVPIRALLNWVPVQAHATAHKVAAFYVAHSPTAAAFVPEWDTWREAGVTFTPVYTEDFDVDSPEGTLTSAHSEAVLELLDKALFVRQGGLESIIGPIDNCSLLLSGIHGNLALALNKKLTGRGVAHERCLFCDYF